MTQVTVIGGGAWGTALACVARRAGNETVIWARDAKAVTSINTGHGNPHYLADIRLEADITASTDLAAVTRNADTILMVVPSQFVREISVSMAAHIRPATPVTICAKGIEQGTGKLMTEVIAETLPIAKPAVLSGPTFAQEVARDLPTAVTLAAQEADIGERLAEELGTAHFRPYVSDDLIGAEIGGAVKNVLAIACGIVTGRDLGDNARAALITRGLAEIVRLGAAKGARMETLMGLSGIGDLTLTCNAMQSRNFSLGVGLGQGRTIPQVLSERRAVTEGIYSASSVVALARDLRVEMPICQAVDRVVNNGEDIDQAIASLLSRPFARERAGEN